MSRRSKIGIGLVLVVVLIALLTPAMMRTPQNSAYAACRNEALATKGYGVWKHQYTIPLVFRVQVVFSDGYNDLTCNAVGFGYSWMVTGTMETLVGCGLDIDTPCPRDYFGVYP